MNPTDQAQTLQLVATFLAPLEHLPAKQLRRAVTRGLAPLDDQDRETLVRQLVHWGKVLDDNRLQRPRAPVIHEVIHQVGNDALLEGLLEHNDTRLLTCLTLSPEQARQVAWSSFASGQGIKALQLTLAQQYPDATLATLVAGFWGYREKLDPELASVLDSWLIRSPKGVPHFVQQLWEAAEEYQGVGSDEVALMIGVVGMKRSGDLADELQAVWGERFAGGLLAHRLVHEASLRRVPDLELPRPWSVEEQADFAQWTHRPDAPALAHQALGVLDSLIEHSFTPLSPKAKAASSQEQFSQEMAQIIVQIMDREQIQDPWRSVWKTGGPLQTVLVAVDRARELAARPAPAPVRRRPRS